MEKSKITLEELVAKETVEDVYKDLKKIGEGAAGEIFSATNTRTGTVAALKKMLVSDDTSKLIATEIYIMKNSKHVNIVEV